MVHDSRILPVYDSIIRLILLSLLLQAAYSSWRHAALVESLAALAALQQLPEYNAQLEVCVCVPS
jgi:hypothetical protein